MTNTLKKTNSLYFDDTDLSGLESSSTEHAVPIDDPACDATQSAIIASVGDLLRDTRLKSGLDFNHIAQDLHISKRYMQAIENNNIAELPERVYTLGFVKSYAQYLGLNSFNIVQRFKDEVMGETTRIYSPVAKPLESNVLPQRLLIGLTAVLALAVVIGSWIYYHHDPVPLTQKIHVPPVVDKKIDQSIQEYQQRPPAISESQVSPTSSQDSASLSTAQVPQTAGSAAEPVESSTIANPAPTPTTPVPAPTAVTESSIVADKPVITLHFSALTWIEIRKDLTSQPLVSRDFKAGESFSFKWQPGMLFSTGNAGGVQVKINQAEPVNLGKPGEVIKNMSLIKDHSEKIS